MSNTVSTVVLIESPFSGNISRNVAYAQRAMNDSRARGEIPIVSHILWTQHEKCPNHFTSDYDEKYTVTGRKQALESLKVLRERVDKVIFMIDYGYSHGMLHGLTHCKEKGLKYETRKLGDLEQDIENASRRK